MRADRDYGDSQAAEDEGMRLCDRTDIFAFGLLLWEMLSGDVRDYQELVLVARTRLTYTATQQPTE